MKKLNKVELPVIKNAADISFGSLQYVEDVIGAFLGCKRTNGKAWDNAKSLVDVHVSTDGNVHLTLKVHGIDTSRGDDSKKPDIVKFGYNVCYNPLVPDREVR